MNQVEIRGMAHITGGGFYENIPRIFSRHTPLCAVVNDPLKDGYDGGWKVPPIFHRIAYGIKNAGEDILRTNPETKKLMFNTYNMGIGFVLALSPNDVQKAATFLEDKGFPAWEIGRVEKAQSPGEGLRFV
jgi:phosphoribosylformylglycinamidine cyclo-ligase